MEWRTTAKGPSGLFALKTLKQTTNYCNAFAWHLGRQIIFSVMVIMSRATTPFSPLCISRTWHFSHLHFLPLKIFFCTPMAATGFERISINKPLFCMHNIISHFSLSQFTCIMYSSLAMFWYSSIMPWSSHEVSWSKLFDEMFRTTFSSFQDVLQNAAFKTPCVNHIQ